jgi:hypothetical protein
MSTGALWKALSLAVASDISECVNEIRDRGISAKCSQGVRENGRGNAQSRETNWQSIRDKTIAGQTVDFRRKRNLGNPRMLQQCVTQRKQERREQPAEDREEQNQTRTLSGASPKHEHGQKFDIRSL